MSVLSISRRRLVAGVVAVGACVGVLGLGGCVGYNVYPPMEGERGFTNVNSDPFPPVMTEALRWAVLRYPPTKDAEWFQPSSRNVGVQTFAINLPAGLSRPIAEAIVRNVGNDAQPMIPGNENLPIYHVARVWVKGDEAKVDLVRPVAGVAFDNQGVPVTQGITLNMRGGVNWWRVTSHRLWSFNSLQPPALNYLPGTTPDTGAAQPRGSQPRSAPMILDDQSEAQMMGEQPADAPTEPTAPAAPGNPASNPADPYFDPSVPASGGSSSGGRNEPLPPVAPR